MVYFYIININIYIYIFIKQFFFFFFFLNKNFMTEIEPQFHESQFYFNNLHYKRIASSI